MAGEINFKDLTRIKRDLIPPSTVCRRYNISRMTLRRWCESERVGFPQPIAINCRVHRWDRAEIDAWERLRTADRNGAATA